MKARWVCGSVAWAVGVGMGAWPVWGQTVIHVSRGGNDGNTGLGWETAKLTVQAGLNAAVSGDQVWVAAGTYVGCITLKEGVGLYGGFAGGESALSQRDWKANETILDGNQQDTVVFVPEESDETTRIDGFTIRNGIGKKIDSWRYGGGIYCRRSTATIANNLIRENVAAGGGGIYCNEYSATITNNVIKENNGYYGGGVGCSAAWPTITNNAITANSAAFGGGIWCAYSFSATITNNTIVANSAMVGGGIWCDDTVEPVITNTIVAFNLSGIYRSGVSPGSLTLRHNCVYGNAEGNYIGVTNPTGMEGNLSVDPKIAGWEYGKWHIQGDSPCMEAGENGSVLGDFDLDGQARVQPTGGTVDIGVDESDGTVWAAEPNVIVRVAPEGDDSNDGADWTTAKRTVQAAIDVAFALGGEVWVKGGTYRERITLRARMHVYGGFSGRETEKDQRDCRAYVTVLDGQEGGSVVRVLMAGYGVSTIDGFTITNGSASYGGGIYCEYSSPTISNNIISANTAYHDGGGISCTTCCPMITDNTIRQNTAYGNGGGVFCTESSPTIRNNVIRQNDGWNGGGLSLQLSSPTIVDNVIAGNIAEDGGGIAYKQSSPTIAKNTIAGNQATHDGGGIACEDSAAMIVQNRIVGNAAQRGGGIRCRGVVLTGNYPTIVNNTIATNEGTNGGGIACIDSYATIANTIIAFNWSGVYVYGSRAPTVRYVCAYGNTCYRYRGIADPTGTNGNVSGSPMFVRRASAGADGVWGTEDDDYGDLRLRSSSACIDAGNNGAVPKDKTDVDGDGDTTEPLPVDLAGRPRFVDDPTADTGVGTGPIVDMGAYERRASVAADLDWDYDVDGFDFLTFANCYNGSERAPAGRCQEAESDFEGDGDVDGFDFLTFANCYNGSDRAALCR